jgi:serine protease Do
MKVLPVFILAIVFFSLSPSLPSSWADTLTGEGEMAEPRLFSFADVVRQEKRAVVNIRSRQPLADRGGDLDQNHPFWDLFGKIIPKEFHQQSLGTGFIIRKEGLILTNHHVIEDMDQVIVRLADEREFDAEVIGRDAKTDIALLKIKSREELPAVRFGDSESLEVGEWVVAIGNPFGLEQTVTVGIVSAKGRMIGMGPYDDYIQTDASINPGNSGGPLFNVRGEVVGMNTAIRSEGSGIGFAIPIQQVLKILPQLEQEGKVTRGWLGVMIQDVTKESIDSLAPDHQEGVLISDVFDNSPAAKAGIQQGDVIIEFDGKKVTHMRYLPFMVSETPVGKIVKVKAVRNGRGKTFRVKIEKLED